MNNLTSQAIWEGLGVPLPKDYSILPPLHQEVDALKQENNQAFILIVTLTVMVAIVVIYNIHQTHKFELYKRSKEATP
jgi:hypothetical protein